MDIRNPLYQALTGNKGADVSGKGDDVLGQLRAIGGTSRRTKSGIDLTAAAKKLGVQRRTVERWVAAAEGKRGQKPSGGSAKKLAKISRQAASTKAGRRAAVGGWRSAGGSARISITGLQGPAKAGRDYKRQRTTTLVLDPDQVEAMMDAYENGGEKGFMSWATKHWDDEYLPDWGFDDIDDIGIDGQSGGRWS